MSLQDIKDGCTHFNITMPRMKFFCSRDQFNGSNASDVGWEWTFVSFWLTDMSFLGIYWVFSLSIWWSMVNICWSVNN